MTDVRLSALSKEYVRIQVVAKEAGIVINPTTDSVYLAFLTSASLLPQSGDFFAASWETDLTTVPNSYFARIIIGPGSSVVLVAGTYFVWIKVVDAGGEVPIRYVGNVIVE